MSPSCLPSYPLLPLLKHDVATVAVPKPALQVTLVNIIIIILSDLEAAGETEALTLARVYEGSLEEASLGQGPVTQAIEEAQTQEDPGPRERETLTLVRRG